MNHKGLQLSADDLERLTTHDILYKLKQAKICYPPPVSVPVPSATAAKKLQSVVVDPSSYAQSGPSSSSSSGPFASSGSGSGLAPNPPTNTTTTKNEEEQKQLIVLVTPGMSSDPRPSVPMPTAAGREKALETMEAINARITSARSKLHNQVELRNQMAVDNDFDADDIARFDECIQRCQQTLQQDMKGLADRVRAYQEFVRRRQEKHMHVFNNGCGDDILQSDWSAKQQDTMNRLSSLEKAAGVLSGPLLT
jgi:hypothetical protein